MANYNTNRFTTIDSENNIRRYETGEDAMAALNERMDAIESDHAYLMTAEDANNMLHNENSNGYTTGVMVAGVATFLTGCLLKVIDHFANR